MPYAEGLFAAIDARASVRFALAWTRYVLDVEAAYWFDPWVPSSAQLVLCPEHADGRVINVFTADGGFGGLNT